MRAPRNLRGIADAARARPLPRGIDARATDDGLGPQQPRRVDTLGIVAADELEPPIPRRAFIDVGADIVICALAPRRRWALAVACSCSAAASLERGAQSSFIVGQ